MWYPASQTLPALFPLPPALISHEAFLDPLLATPQNTVLAVHSPRLLCMGDFFHRRTLVVIGGSRLTLTVSSLYQQESQTLGSQVTLVSRSHSKDKNRISTGVLILNPV